MTQPTPAAIAIACSMIRTFEGCVLHPYWDAYGHVWTMGYGFITDAQDHPVRQSTPPLTPSECEALLQAKLRANYLPTVLAVAGLDATDGEIAALCSFAWNLGVGTLSRSAIPGRLRVHDIKGAGAALQAYVFAGGKKLSALVDRRAREAMVLTGSPWHGAASVALVGGQLAHPAPAASLSASVSEADRLNDAQLAALHA